MNLPDIKSYEDEAIHTVISVINKAHEKLGMRLSLSRIAYHGRETFSSIPQVKTSLAPLVPPLIITGEKFIDDTIRRRWRLDKTFKHVINFLGGSQDLCSQFYYFEAIFSQPTVSYPIPQVTASVYFRVEDKHMVPPKSKTKPTIHFRVEGSHTDYNMRFVLLPADWLLGLMQMKLKYFKRLEEINIF